MERILDRRIFMKASAAAAGSQCLPDFLLGADRQRQRPNIFFAIADDWGWPHSSVYGDKVVNTPSFEKIAANGILFKNAFVSAPSCTPSRNAILTGQYHWRLGFGANLYSYLPEEHKTYPNILEDNGYFVGHYRKGFGPGKDRDRPVAGKKFKDLQTFLKEKPQNKPFCFWFGAYDPHRGYQWQSGMKSGMKPEDVEIPPYFPDTPEVRMDICDYYFEVQRFDREVGEALELLKKTGELDNTIVVMTGDNGWPFPRGKSNLYDFGVRMPLAIQWPAKIRSKRVVDDFVSFTDFAPTFLEAAGLKPLAAMTGRSLMNIFTSERSGQVDPLRDHVLTGKERHTPAQKDSMGGTPMRAIRNDSYLYIHNFEPDRWPAGHPEESMRGPGLSDIDDSPTKSALVENRNDPEKRKYYELACGKRPRHELYDLRKDPWQLENVAYKAEYTDIRQRLEKQLMNESRQSEDPRVSGEGNTFDAYPYLGRMEKK